MRLVSLSVAALTIIFVLAPVVALGEPVVHPPDDIYSALAVSDGDKTRGIAGFFDIDPGDSQFSNFVRAAQDGVDYSLADVTLTKVVPAHIVAPDTFPAGTIAQSGAAYIRLHWPLMYEITGTTFRLTVEYTTSAPYDDDGPAGPNDASLQHTEVWSWVVVDDLPHRSLLLEAMHDAPLGTSEVPLISDDYLYTSAQTFLADAIAYQAAGDDYDMSWSVQEYGGVIQANCMPTAPLFPNPTGPGMGTADTLENPACSRLLTDSIGGGTQVSFTNYVYQAYPASSGTTDPPVAGALDFDPTDQWSKYIQAAWDGVPYVIDVIQFAKETPDQAVCPGLLPPSTIKELGEANITLHWPLIYEPPFTSFTIQFSYTTLVPYDDDGGGPDGLWWHHTVQWAYLVDATVDSLGSLLEVMHGSTPQLITDEALYLRLKAKLNEARLAADIGDVAAYAAAIQEFRSEAALACGVGIVNTPQDPACCKLLLDCDCLLLYAGS